MHLNYPLNKSQQCLSKETIQIQLISFEIIKHQKQKKNMFYSMHGYDCFITWYGGLALIKYRARCIKIDVKLPL